MLFCSDGTYYVGLTNNLEPRLMQHEQGVNPDAYTFSRRPLSLVYYEIFNDAKAAIAFEKKIKKWSKAKKEILVNKKFDSLPLLSKKNLINPPKIIKKLLQGVF